MGAGSCAVELRRALRKTILRRSVADSPIAEVRDIGETQARLLKEEFGVETVGDLGTHPLFDVAWAIVMLAESED